MENLLLKDSNYKKRSNLQSVRSYLENESKSILPCSKAIPKSVLDSPPNNLRKTKTGFGAKFRDLLHGSCTQEVDLVLAKRKVRNISSEFEEKARYTPDTAIVEKRIRPSPSVKQPDLLEEKSLFAPKNLISQDKECVSFSKNAGFSNLQWRERMRTNTSLTSSYTSQSFLSTKSESTQYVVPEESPIQSDPSPSPAISSSPPTENTTKLSRNIKSLNTEVSSNFIKKDLRRRGSYKHKGGIKSRKRDSRRQNPSCAEIGCSDDAELERGRSYGLSGFGLDPFHLYLEKKQLKNHNPIKNEVSVPLCTGHQMPAKLMTVKKSTMNKVNSLHSTNLTF